MPNIMEIASNFQRHRMRRSSLKLSMTAFMGWVAVALQLFLAIACAEEVSDTRSEEADTTSSLTGQDSQATSAAPTSVDDDDYVTTVLVSLTFAFVLTAIGTLLGFVAVVDDSILRQYKAVGVPVEADVVAVEFLRGGASAADCVRPNEAEYNVTVDYDQRIADDTYKIRVRKQLKAKESDFRYTNAEAVADASGVPSTIRADKRIRPQAVDPENLLRGDRIVPNDVIRETVLSKYKLNGTKLTVLVMSDHPKSGLLEAHVNRSTGIRHRLSMILFVGGLLLLAMFCVYMAGNSMGSHSSRANTGSLVLTTSSSFVAVLAAVLLEAPVVYHIFQKLVTESLSEEYLNDAELVPAHDESSLSSASDIFLDERYRNLSATRSTLKSEFSGSAP